MESKIKIGDRVRSFDFPGGHSGGFQLEPHEHACYVEGKVENLGRFPDFHNDCDRYAIRVDKRVFGGKSSRNKVNEMVYPPVNGTRCLFGDGVTRGVQKID